MSRLRVVDTEDRARDSFQTFHDRRPTRRVEMTWTWPKKMQEVGVGQAEMYRSNKWKRNLSQYEDYKHIAESPRLTFVREGFLRDWDNPQKKLEVYGDKIELMSPMPKHFTILAPLLGVQLRLYRQKADGTLYLPPGDEALYEVRMDRGMLGGAEHPETGEVFLLVYTKTGGVGMIICGNRLDIERDGIVG